MPDDTLVGGPAACREILEQRLAEPAPGRIQILTGPRQVGKTTILLEIAEHHGDRALYAAADGPEAALPGFWERLWGNAEERARSGSAILLLDEVQHLSGWAQRLKGEWDRLRRLRVPLHIVASGSSALHLGAGSQESLLGRFERVTMGHWSAASMAEAFVLDPREAADILVRFGSYPGAFSLRHEEARWRAYIRDAIVEPAIGRDVVGLGAVRRPALLRQVFALCASLPAQIVSLQKLQGQLQEKGVLETIAHYLELLRAAYLVAPLEKHSTQALRRRAAPPKIVVLNNALLSAVGAEGFPDQAREPARFGTWVENACLAHALNQGQQVTYWREEPLEVDAVLTGSWGKWAVEIKTGPFESGELRGLLEFCRRHPSYRPLVLGESAEAVGAARAAVPSMAWRDFLLGGPPAGA